MGNNTAFPPSREEGESKKSSDDPIDTLGGRMHLRWDEQVEMSTNAHHVLFSEFLRVSGLFDHLVETAPLVYTSNNAPEKRNVIGTAALCILDGAKRFRHFDSLFGDTISAELFGMSKTQSCDSVRRGLLGMNPEAALKWVWNENLHCLAPLLAQQYALDLDPTVKTLYGHQEGAAVGYNPHKHGRPSHCFHVMSIAELRMSVGFVILPGNETSGADSMPMLELFFGGVPEELLPYLIRGDVGYGTEKIIVICEKYKRHYFKVGRNCSDWRTYLSESRDGGRRWSEARELVPGECYGGRGPVRNQCLRLPSGRWLAPASREIGRWRAFIDLSDDDGRTWRAANEIAMPASPSDAGVIQPTLWEGTNGIVHAYMRSNTGKVWESMSADAGETWSMAVPTAIPNNNSGIDMVRAGDGCLHLALNPVSGNWASRSRLELWKSSDEGASWQVFRVLEREKEGEFSYPCLRAIGSDTLAITYTWNRKHIAFVECRLNRRR